MRTVKELRELVDKKKGQKELLEQENIFLKKEEKELTVQYNAILKAREVIQQVAQKTLQELSVNVSDLVTQAIKAVFEDPYTFVVDFVTKRNQTECEFYLHRRNNNIDPLEASGGGVADITSFALRSVFLKLSGKRPLLLLDEPFKFLSFDLQIYASEMLKAISEELGIQVIMVTHLPKIINSVDNVIYMNQKEGISNITYKKS